MEYPVWQLALTGGGFWVALISTLHVYVAQFAVGGGLYLTLTEISARRSGSPELLAHARAHSKFFLLLTMVFGAVTGVGIWFTIALTSPQATITLIHTFLFAWATEWTFFLGEIVALLVYFYGWDRLTARQHVTVGWLYFIFGWLSLFMINGILAFMLTPGQWLETARFWDGFFNPTFWPQLVFRTFICVMAAGLFGFVTASLMSMGEARTRQMRNCSLWTLLGLGGMLVSGWWYYHSLPPEQAMLVMFQSARVGNFLHWFMALTPVVLAGGLLLVLKLPRKPAFALSLVVLLLGLGLTGSFEFMREAARKPYLIFNHTYSNSLLKADIPAIDEQGMLQRAKWVPEELRTEMDEMDDDTVSTAGQWLFQLQCASCHSLNGPLNDILPRTAPYTTQGMDAFLSGMGVMNPYMPPFAGRDSERGALAVYLTQTLHGTKTAPPPEPQPRELEMPGFDPDEDSYVLLAWARQGLRFVSDTGAWTLQPPGSTLRAQVFLRDSLPEAAGENLQVRFAVDGDYPAEGLNGVMVRVAPGTYEAKNIPAMPYRTDKSYDQYPTFTVTAIDTESNETVAQTKAVLPASTRMGCMNCHGAQWKDAANAAGIADNVAANVLAVHDRRSGTDLQARAAKGTVVDCRSCHTAKQGRGNTETLNLSASMHGFHAPYLSNTGSQACANCHPDDMQRDPHKDMDITCVNCHGNMENHSIALLKAEQAEGKNVGERMARITPRDTALEDINPRRPWEQEPDCLTCHADFAAPDSDTAFNRWTPDAAALYGERSGDMEAVMCAACHGSPHATYPALENPVNPQLDNIQPIQYTGEPQTIGASQTCAVCHTESMEDAAHHPGMGLE